MLAHRTWHDAERLPLQKAEFDSIVSTDGVAGCLHNLVVHVGNTNHDVQANNIHANKMVALTNIDC